jgi:hypothetical protein
MSAPLGQEQATSGVWAGPKRSCARLIAASLNRSLDTGRPARATVRGSATPTAKGLSAGEEAGAEL